MARRLLLLLLLWVIASVCVSQHEAAWSGDDLSRGLVFDAPPAESVLERVFVCTGPMHSEPSLSTALLKDLVYSPHMMSMSDVSPLVLPNGHSMLTEGLTSSRPALPSPSTTENTTPLPAPSTTSEHAYRGIAATISPEYAVISPFCMELRVRHLEDAIHNYLSGGGLLSLPTTDTDTIAIAPPDTDLATASSPPSVPMLLMAVLRGVMTEGEVFPSRFVASGVSQLYGYCAASRLVSRALPTQPCQSERFSHVLGCVSGRNKGGFRMPDLEDAKSVTGCDPVCQFGFRYEAPPRLPSLYVALSVVGWGSFGRVYRVHSCVRDEQERLQCTETRTVWKHVNIMPQVGLAEVSVTRRMCGADGMQCFPGEAGFLIDIDGMRYTYMPSLPDLLDDGESSGPSENAWLRQLSWARESILGPAAQPPSVPLTRGPGGGWRSEPFLGTNLHAVIQHATSFYGNLPLLFGKATSSHDSATAGGECLQASARDPVSLYRLLYIGLWDRAINSLVQLHGDAGMAHRDIKLKNLVLSPAGVRLIDFGSARLFRRPFRDIPAEWIPTDTHSVTQSDGDATLWFNGTVVRSQLKRWVWGLGGHHLRHPVSMDRLSSMWGCFKCQRDMLHCGPSYLDATVQYADAQLLIPRYEYHHTRLSFGTGGHAVIVRTVAPGVVAPSADVWALAVSQLQWLVQTTADPFSIDIPWSRVLASHRQRRMRFGARHLGLLQPVMDSTWGVFHKLLQRPTEWFSVPVACPHLSLDTLAATHHPAHSVRLSGPDPAPCWLHLEAPLVEGRMARVREFADRLARRELFYRLWRIPSLSQRPIGWDMPALEARDALMGTGAVLCREGVCVNIKDSHTVRHVAWRSLVHAVYRQTVREAMRILKLNKRPVFSADGHSGWQASAVHTAGALRMTGMPAAANDSVTLQDMYPFVTTLYRLHAANNSLVRTVLWRGLAADDADLSAFVRGDGVDDVEILQWRDEQWLHHVVNDCLGSPEDPEHAHRPLSARQCGMLLRPASASSPLARVAQYLGDSVAMARGLVGGLQWHAEHRIDAQEMLLYR